MNDSILGEARRALAQYRAREDGADPQIVNFPSSGVLELHHALAMAVKNEIFQVIPFYVDSWQTEGFENVVWREAARSGRRIRRIYVLPHRGIATGLLKEQMNLDAASGIEARVLVVSRIPQSEQAKNLDGMWILDEQAIVVTTRGEASTTPTEWTISERESDLRSGVESWNKMWKWAGDAQLDLGDGIDLEEPLVLSADLINGVAQVLCTSDQVDPEGCAWYHSAWQYLRLLDMVSTPTWHSGFYKKELVGFLAGKKAIKTLITGTADYSMLAYVDEAMRVASADVEIGVLDLCPTPLFACRWYAKRRGFRIATFEENLLNFSNLADASVDLICSDALLTRFRRDDAKIVLSVWRRLLRQGGRVVTSVRMHPLSSSARDPEAAIQDFRERAFQRAKRWRSFLHRTPNEIAQMAEVYARRMKSEDIGGDKEIRALFGEAGFRIEHSKLAEVPGELYPTVYLEISCEKNG